MRHRLSTTLFCGLLCLVVIGSTVGSTVGTNADLITLTDKDILGADKIAYDPSPDFLFDASTIAAGSETLGLAKRSAGEVAHHGHGGHGGHRGHGHGRGRHGHGHRRGHHGHRHRRGHHGHGHRRRHGHGRRRRRGRGRRRGRRRRGRRRRRRRRRRVRRRPYRYGGYRIHRFRRIRYRRRYRIRGGVQVGDIYVARGIRRGGGLFSISFFAGRNIAFHLVFRSRGPGGVIAMRSRRGRRGWSKDIRHHWMKGMGRGQKFTVAVYVMHHAFVVEINGVRLKKHFPHIFPVNRIHAVSFLGRSKTKWIVLRVFRAFRYGNIGAWKRIGGALTRVSMGGLGVWGVNKGGAIYYRRRGRWIRYGGSLNDISVGGSQIWGVNRHHHIYMRTGRGRWKRIRGGLKQVSVSENDNVWGVNKHNHIYRWLGTKWVRVKGHLHMLNVGFAGMWGCYKNKIWYRTGTYGDKNISGFKWKRVGGHLTWVDSGYDMVIGIMSHKIWQRTGVSAGKPTGKGWKQIGGRLSMISTFKMRVWGTNRHHHIYTAKFNPPSKFKASPMIWSFSGQLLHNWSSIRKGRRYRIKGGLHVGDIFFFTGKPTRNRGNFAINFRAGRRRIAFHLVFRLRGPGRGMIIMNSRRRRWGREVRHRMLKGIARGQKFTIVVRITHRFYIVEINGIRLRKHFHHRIPLRRVGTINFTGRGARFFTTKVYRQFVFGKLGSWKKVSGSLMRVSMGGVGVWGVNKHHAIYYRKGTKWVRYGGSLMGISVGGTQIWGVNKHHHIYMRTKTSKWKKIGGSLKQVSVSERNHVWGVNKHYHIYRWIGAKGSWVRVKGHLHMLNVGFAGMWGCYKKKVWYRTGTYGDLDTSGFKWKRVGGHLTWVDSGYGMVIGIMSHKIWMRTGMNAGRPTGLKWRRIRGGLKMVSTFKLGLWGVNKKNHIYKASFTSSSVQEFGTITMTEWKTMTTTFTWTTKFTILFQSTKIIKRKKYKLSTGKLMAGDTAILSGRFFMGKSVINFQGKGFVVFQIFLLRTRKRKFMMFRTLRRGKVLKKVKYGFPKLGKKSRFNIMIEVSKKGYYVTINGQTYGIYKHVKPAKFAKFFRVGGKGASFTEVKIFRSSAMNLRSISAKKKYPLRGGLKFYDVLMFTGQSTSSTKRWSFQITTKKGWVVLFVDFRPSGKGYIVLNSKKGGWLKEKRLAWPGIKKGDKFVIILKIMPKFYLISVNGVQYKTKFKHRISLKLATKVQMTGSAKWSSMRIYRDYKRWVVKKLVLTTKENYPWSSKLYRLSFFVVMKKYSYKTHTMTSFKKIKVCKGKPSTKATACGKKRTMVYYKVRLCNKKTKKCKLVYLRRIPFQYFTPKKSYRLRGNVKKRCKVKRGKKVCRFEFLVCTKNGKTCSKSMHTTFPLGMQFSGSSKSITYFMMSQSITFLHKKYSTKTWRLNGKVTRKGKLHVFRLCHYKKKKKCKLMKTFYMPKGYMKAKLIYFKKSLEGYPYSSTITIMHRSKITQKYKGWKTKKISGYHKVCKGRPITKKKPCNKAKVTKYYIVKVTKGKKTKKLYTKRIPYSHLTPKKSFVITSKVTRKCKKKKCVHRFKVCRVKKMSQCYFVSSKPFPVALGYKGAAKDVTTYMVKFKAVYMAKKYDTNVYIIKGKIKKKGKKYYFTLCKTNGKGCVNWATVYHPPKYKIVAIKKPKLKKSMEGFFYSAGIHIYKPFVMSAKYPLAKYIIKGKITRKTTCTIKKLPTKKARCAKKNRKKYYRLKLCKKPANKKCTIVYVARVPYSHHNHKWLIAGKVTKKCKISKKKKKCSCRFRYKACAGKTKYCALAVKKSFPKLKYRGSTKSINTVMVKNKKSYLKKKYSVKSYTVSGWVKYSRADVCTAHGKHTNKVTKKIYVFKICTAKGKKCKTTTTYYSVVGLYGITKKVVIKKTLKLKTKGKLLWTSHVTIIKPLKVSKKFPKKSWKTKGRKKQVTLCKGKATTKTKSCSKAAKKKYYKLTFVMNKKTWITKVIYTKRIALYYLSPNKQWTVAGGVTEKCKKKCKCVYKWKSCNAKAKTYCVLAIAKKFPGALKYSGSKKKVNTVMIKNHIRYLMILKSNKKYKYKSIKGKKGKCYTKYTVVICSGKKYSKCKEVITKYKVNKKYKLYIKPKVVKWVLTKKMKNKCIGQIKKKLFIPCKLDKKWFVVGCGTQVKKCYNKTCGNKKGKTQIQICNKKMWAYTVCPRPKQYFPVLPWQKCAKKKKSKKLQKREVTTPNEFDGAFPDWMMPGGSEHPAFTDVVEESSLDIAKRAAKKKAKDTKVVHYKSKTVKFILPDKTHKMKCRQYFSWEMPKCLHKPNLKLVFTKAFVKYYNSAKKKYPSVCKKYKGYFLKGSIANEDKCWKKKYGNFNYGKCHKLNAFKVCKVIEKKDDVTTKCVSATTWNKPKCFKKLNLKPLYKKKFTTWVTSKIKPLSTKCAKWKKAGYTINGNVKNKEKCWNKSYSGSKYKKCVTTYKYRLCKEVKVKGKAAMKCKKLTTSTKLSCLKKTDITAFHKKNFIIYLRAKYPTKCKKYKKYKLKGSIKAKNKCWKKDQMGHTVNYCGKMYHYKLCKFTDKGKDVIMKCSVLTSFTKPKCYSKAKMKPYYQKKFNIVIGKVAKKYPIKSKKYKGYYLTNTGIKSLKKCYTKTYEKKYKYKKCHKLATYTVCKPKGTSTKVTFTCVKLVSWDQPKSFKTLATKPLWKVVFNNHIKTKVMVKYEWKTAYCPKNYYVYKSIKRSKKCWTKVYWGKVDTKVTFQKCHKLYKYKICKTVATKSGIPKVSCKTYTTWTKPKCKQIKKKLTFWRAKFALYIKKKIRPQYTLDCAKYKGRLVIKQSLKRKQKCFTKTYGNNTGKLCHNLYKFKLCIKPSLKKEMPDDCAKRVTWTEPKCWPTFDLENHWKAIFLAYLAKSVVPKYKLPCVQYKKYFVYGDIKYVKKCWQKKIGDGTLQKCHKLHKYAVCKIITKGDGSKALKCKDLLTWKYPRCFRRVRIKLVFWKSKWQVFIKKKIIPVNSFDQSTYGSWIVLGDVTYTEKCFTKKYGKVTAKKCHQMAVFKACKKLHLDKPKKNKCKKFTVWTYPKKLKHISEAEYYTSVYAYYIKHTELPKLKVPCKAKKGYLRKAYAQSTVCCSKCCSTFNSKKHTMVLTARKCYEGKRGGFMFNYCTDTYKTNICNSKDIKSCVEIETLKKPTCFKDYNPKDVKWEAAIVAAGVKYYKKKYPDACDLGEYYGYSLIGNKIKTKKKCKKFTVNNKSKKYCHTIHTYKICKQQVQGGFNCAKVTAYTGPQCFYILEKSYYYKEDFSHYIQEQRGKYPIPESKGKWFINKEISRMEKCWDKTYGGKKKKYCHRLYSYKICYYKSNKKLVCKAHKSWAYPTGLEHNRYMSTSIKYGWYFYKIGLFRYDPKVWFVYGVITKVNIDVNEYAAWIKSWNQEFAYHQHRSDINSFYSASESEETVNVYEFQLCRTFKTGLSTTKIYCKHKVSRYPIDNLKFKIKAKPKGAAVIKYGAWKVVQSSVGKKCYQTHWKKQLYNLCVKAKTVKKCRKVTKGASTKKACFLVETRLSETYKAVKVPNGNFDSAVPDNDHNGKVPKKWKSFNGLRVDTLSADLKLQGADMISNSNNGGTFVRLNSNNIIIKEIGTQVTGFRKGYMYVAVFEQALMYNWGHCEGHFRVQLGKQVHFSPMMRLPSKYPSMTKWETVKIGYYIGTSPDLNLKISAVRGHHCHNPMGGSARTFTDLLIDAIYFECIGPLPPDGAPGLGHPALFNVQGYQGYTSRILPKVYPSGSGKITRGGYSKRVIRGSSSGGYMQIIYETNHGTSVHTVPLSHGIRRVKGKKK